MPGTTALPDAYSALLDAAATVADSDASPVPRPGEWHADQILAHVTLVNAATISAVTSVASGTITTYDNRAALDTWTINRVITLAGGNSGLRNRIQTQADALCALTGPNLSETELDTLVPTLLLSNGKVLVDRPTPLRDLIAGLTEVEIPGHAQQLIALLPAITPAET